MLKANASCSEGVVEDSKFRRCRYRVLTTFKEKEADVAAPLQAVPAV